MADDRLKALREQIDLIDNQILALLNQRAGVVLSVGKAKEGSEQSFYVPSR
ncbi:MAG: chorismate mutase, partial [Deltaproteobacteria bacterium]|nr:chorismate mutase [Deltaproteobacteria bacterium]